MLFFGATQTLSYRVCIIEYTSYPSASKLTATFSLKPFILLKKKKNKARKFEEEEMITISNVAKSEHILVLYII